MNDTNGYKPRSAGGTSDVIQEGGRSRYSLRLQGAAERVGYEIPRPVLLSANGRTVTETNSAFRCWQSAALLGVPIYTAAWIVDYAVDNSPGTVRPKNNLENGS